VAWDAPGAGDSADPPESWGIAGYAQCLAEFVDSLGLDHPHVVGLSFGGVLALELPHATINVPTLLIHGDQDVRAPLSVAQRLHTAIPQSTLTVLPGRWTRLQRRASGPVQPDHHGIPQSSPGLTRHVEGRTSRTGAKCQTETGTCPRRRHALILA
jgi:Alpha/beta hydrolase family